MTFCGLENIYDMFIFFSRNMSLFPLLLKLLLFFNGNESKRSTNWIFPPTRTSWRDRVKGSAPCSSTASWRRSAIPTGTHGRVREDSRYCIFYTLEYLALAAWVCYLEVWVRNDVIGVRHGEKWWLCVLSRYSWSIAKRYRVAADM